MRLRVMVELETYGGDAVSDWIDKLKKNEQSQLSEKNSQDEMRLHKAKIIRSKMPAFLEMLKERVEADCNKLRAEFPTNKHRDCFVTGVRPDRFTIKGGGLPQRNLDLELNVDGLCVGIFESEILDRGQPAIQTKGNREIGIEVDEEEQLQFRFRGKLHRDIESLSEHLVSYVARIQE
jgi:hypothetical protein